MASFFPKVGAWYQELESSANFEVVAVDEKHGTIEVQYEDGDIAEFDIESWGRMNMITMQNSDLFSSEESVNAGNLFDNQLNDIVGDPLDMIEPDNFTGFDDLF